MANGGLLQSIINPAQADVLGSLDQGRERQATDLAGELLGQTVTGKIGDLARLSPDKFLAFAKATNTPITSQGRIKNLIGVNVAAAKLLDAGQPEFALQFLQEEISKIESTSGQPAEKLRAVAQAIQSGDQETINNFIQSGRALDPSLKKGEDFTLGKDQQRFDAAGNLIAGAKPSAEVDQKQVNALRKDILGVSKTFRQVDEANERIKKVGRKATAASDISLIFNFMKINDPGSTVREGEFATAQNAAGVPDRVSNLYNQMLKGTRLGVDQREDFLAQAQSLFEGQRISTDNQIENILQQADQDSIERVRVFGKERLGDFDARQAAQTTPIDTTSLLGQLPQGSIDNGDGTFTLPTGEVVEPE